MTDATGDIPEPASSSGDGGGIVVRPYRGYGSREEVFLLGRVFRQPVLGLPSGGKAPNRVVELGRRLSRRGVANAALVARFGGSEQRVVTDRDGYFRVHLRPARPPSADRLWHRIALELTSPVRLTADGEVFVPPAACRHVVVSDIDDTVMYTGVASKAKMLWRLFMRDAGSRVAFPGIAAFLAGLHRGPSGAEANPMLYVSRAPWSIYEVLDEFFNLHRIPVGPLLFLREWGLTLQRPLPRRAKDHKLELIRNMLALYHDLPFVLIGDSGQHDPEVYARITRENPGRVVAIYIRNVSRAPGRAGAIEKLAAEVAEAGGGLVLAADSRAMAEHAVEHGLIDEAAAAEVREAGATEGEPGRAPARGGKPSLRRVERATRRATVRAVRRGAVTKALDGNADGGAPPDVVVEPTAEGRADDRNVTAPRDDAGKTP